MIKTLAKSVRQYKKSAILSPLMITLEVVMEVIIPLLMANMIDFGIEAGDMGYILKMGAALLISALMSMFFGAACGRYAAIASTGFASNLRHDLYSKVQTFSFSEIDRFSTGSIVTRLTTDVSNIQMAFQMMIRMTFRAPLMMIFSLIAAIRIDAKLSLIFVGALPVLGIGMYLLMSRVHPVFERVFKTYDKLNNIVSENLNGIRVVKAFVREDHEREKFGKVSQSIFKDFSGVEKTMAFNMPLMQTCMYACTLLVSWLGARAIIASGNNPDLGLSTGALMSLLSYSMQILGSLMMVSMVFVMLTISRASGERIAEILNTQTCLNDPENPVSEVKDGSISFQDVCFSYSKTADKHCLDHINLNIHSGETIGIIGVTGSSKSTLVSLIPRLYDTTEGCVKVGGIDVRDYGIEALRDGVSVVLQKNMLFSGTIKDNLRWGDPQATDEEMIAACKAACADEFITAFPDGYDTFIEQGGTNVSGGQKQRLCIARALLKKPKVLILDDSTSAVDTHTDARIRSAMRELVPGTTKLIIAQRVASVQDADRIIIMEDGRVQAIGSHDELLATNAAYREIYESQAKGGDEQ